MPYQTLSKNSKVVSNGLVNCHTRWQGYTHNRIDPGQVESATKLQTNTNVLGAGVVLG